jgi:hypothetical protein
MEDSEVSQFVQGISFRSEFLAFFYTSYTPASHQLRYFLEHVELYFGSSCLE